MRTIQFILILTISLFIASGSTGAQTVVFGDSQSPTKATSINDLQVGGSQYDVVFQSQKFAYEIYGPYPGTFNIFDNATIAEDAVDAVDLALNGANATSIGGIDQPGVESPIYNIGYGSLIILQVEWINVWRSSNEDVDWQGLGNNQWTYNLDERSWAVFTITTAVDDDDVSDIPKAYKLFPNYPNPFNPSTTIEFTLPNSDYTTLKVYNNLGAEVATLVSDKLQTGLHKYQFDGSNLASGVYYYQVSAGAFRDVQKMILLR